LVSWCHDGLFFVLLPLFDPLPTLTTAERLVYRPLAVPTGAVMMMPIRDPVAGGTIASFRSEQPRDHTRPRTLDLV